MAISLAGLGCLAQVRIRSLSPAGRLAWTNAVVGPYPAAVYRVEWARSPTGSWSSLAVVTNQTSLTITNPSPVGAPSTFYRVAWTNGHVWRCSIYGTQGLEATGKLYFSASFNSGTWYMTNANPPGGAWRILGRGTLALGTPTGQPTFDTIRIDFLPYIADGDEFWLELPWPMREPLFGTWYQSFQFGGTNSGAFVAEKIVNGH